MIPRPCSGPHNNAWRRAEAADEPHDLTPTWGDPHHCLSCTARAFRQLAELPELLAAVWLEAEYGTTPKTSGTIGRIHIPAWPGQATRLMTDLIVGGLVELEDDLRELRHLNQRPDRGREGQTATGAVTFLLVHLDWALAHHPAAGEPHHRDSANPASQIAYWNRAATKFTRRDALQVQKEAPCPRCERRSLFFADGDSYIECQNAACGTLMTELEYQQWSQVVLAENKLSAQDCEDPDGALKSATAEYAQTASAA